MTLREHKLWPLIEEVGLKKAFSSMMGATIRVPSDMNELRTVIRKYLSIAKTDYEETIKSYANEALKIYSKIQTWHPLDRPKGLQLYGYGVPPATRKLYEALKKATKGD